MEEFLASHGDTVDDEHCFSSSDGRLVGDDHLDFRGHATGHASLISRVSRKSIPLVEFTYNNSYHASKEMAPYEALYGRPCRSLVCWAEVGERPSTALDLVKDTFEKVDLI